MALRGKGDRNKCPPANGDRFSLAVDYKDSIGVVRDAGYDPKSWKYLGAQSMGVQKLRVRVMLVSLGPVRNLTEAKKKVGENGWRLVGGQAIRAFKVKFPQSDGKGPIAFGRFEWQHPTGKACVPYLDDTVDGWGAPYFFFSVDSFFEGWRWLVEEIAEKENSGS